MARRKQRYLDGDYEAAIESFVESHPHVSVEEAIGAYLQKCEELEEGFKEGTPPETIRRLAFDQVKDRFAE